MCNCKELKTNCGCETQENPKVGEVWVSHIDLLHTIVAIDEQMYGTREGKNHYWLSRSYLVKKCVEPIKRTYWVTLSKRGLNTYFDHWVQKPSIDFSITSKLLAIKEITITEGEGMREYLK